MSISDVRERYQQMARMVAEGKGEKELAWISGYSIEKALLLMDDPGFKESVEFYRRQNNG